jgi:hypothetical protein
MQPRDSCDPFARGVIAIGRASIELQARNVLANRLRRWSVEVGRIGSSARRLRHMSLDAYVVRGLRRRARARARIGIEYRCFGRHRGHVMSWTGLVRTRNGMIVNLTPLRGLSADVGSAYEG